MGALDPSRSPPGDRLRAAAHRSPFLVDRGGVLLRELGLTGLPDAFVIDTSGAVLWHGGADAKAEDVVAAAAR